MQPTQGVSYPRSGHGMVYHMIRRHFGDTLIYCDTNNRKHCGCESVPCINPRRTFAKNHDFGLKNSSGVPIIPTERYLIQYRNPVRSISSDYYLTLRDPQSRNDEAGWREYALDSIGYWNRFVDKWVLDFPEDAAAPLFCKYEWLLSNPEESVGAVLSFLSQEPLEDDAVAKLLKKRPIIRWDSLSNFRYYDEGFFREIEAQTSGRLERLGLPSFADGY